MKKKNLKAPKQSPKEQAAVILQKMLVIFNGHAVVILFMFAGLILGMALIRSRSFLDPVRNEDHYNELTAKSNYSSIDPAAVKKLKDSVNDNNVNIQGNLAPNRRNPFNE